VRDGEPETPHGLSWPSSCLGDGRERLRHARTGALDQLSPSIGQRHAARGSGEQYHSQLLFELADGLAHRGRGNLKLARSGAETTQASNGQEDLELGKDGGTHLERRGCMTTVKHSLTAHRLYCV
jgi:hypothetical protein